MKQLCKIGVFSASEELYRTLKKHLPQSVGEVRWFRGNDLASIGGVQLAFVDGAWGNGLITLLERLAAEASYTVVVDHDRTVGDDIPDYLAEGLVDDLLLLPLRPVELLGKIKHFEYLARVHELVSVNSGVKVLIEKFEEDLRVARSIQKSLIPEKFPSVNGVKVTHKYLSGLKSGGDYLDFFEFEDKSHVGILMSDSSGYGLSSAFMSVILRLAIKLSKDEARSPSATIERIFQEIQLTMKPNENLSLFYGILNRKTFELKYASVGNIHFFHGDVEKNRKSGPFTKAFSEIEMQSALKDHALMLDPGDRLVLLTDGFAEKFETELSLRQQIDHAKKDDPVELINEMVYRVKSALETEDDMPEQDCSVMVLDIEKRLMRLAK